MSSLLEYWLLGLGGLYRVRRRFVSGVCVFRCVLVGFFNCDKYFVVHLVAYQFVR